MTQHNRARLMLIGAMGIFGTIGLFVRSISVSSGELALYRAVIAAILLTGYFLAARKTIRFRALGSELPLLIISGAAMGFNWILLFEAYKYTTVSVATLSYYFAPVLVTLACPLLFREKMGWVQWLCFGMSTLGLILITGLGDLSAGANHLTGIAFGLGAAVLYACVMLMNKKIQRVSGIDRTICQFGAAAIVLLPYVLLTDGIHIASMDGTGWIFLLIVALIHSATAYCLYFSGLKTIKGQEAAILSYVDPLVAVIISFTLLKETVTPLQLVGGAMILAFTLINELSPAQKK